MDRIKFRILPRTKSLTAEHEELLDDECVKEADYEKLCCKISHDIPEIPVKLAVNEELYCLKELLEKFKLDERGQGNMLGVAFTMKNITFATDVYNTIVEKIKEGHVKKAAKAKSQPKLNP